MRSNPTKVELPTFERQINLLEGVSSDVRTVSANAGSARIGGNDFGLVNAFFAVAADAMLASISDKIADYAAHVDQQSAAVKASLDAYAGTDDTQSQAISKATRA